MRKLLPLLFLLLFSTISLQAQELDSSMFVTNREVKAILRVGNTIYLGGEFDYVGPNTGSAGIINSSSGEPEPSFPRVNGRVHKTIPDGKGGWFLVGTFNSVGGVPRKNIAHIKPDYTLDTEWDVKVDGQVNCITMAEGVLYLGGTFKEVNGILRNGLVSLNSETGIVLDWKPNIHNEIGSEVRSIAVAKNKVFASGNMINPAVNSLLVAFDATSGEIVPWLQDFKETTDELLGYENTVYILGSFDNIGGKNIRNLAAVDATTGVVKDWQPIPSGGFLKMWMYEDILYVAGSFDKIGGQLRYGLAAINLKTGQTTDWKPDLTAAQIRRADALTVSEDKVYVGGTFYTRNDLSGKVVAFDKTDGKLIPWKSKVSGPINTLSYINGRLLLGGSFNSMGGVERQFLAAVDAISGKPLPWNPKPDDYVTALASSGNSIYIGGQFTNFIGGQPRKHLAAVDAITGLATPFKADADGPVNKISLYQDKVFVTGSFSTIGGKERSSIASLNPYTGEVTDWDAKIGGARAIAFWNNYIYVSGSFKMAAGENRHNLASYNLTTGLLTSWNPQVETSGQVADVAVLHNTIYISGKFSAVGKQSVTNMAALHPESGEALSWHPKPDSYVLKIVPWGDSTLIFSGYFETTSPLHPEIASVSTNSEKITLWNVDLNDIDPYDNGYEYGSLQSINPTGKSIYLGGMFRTINGYVVSCGFAALGERPEAATNIIKGNIFNDTNTNCVKEQTEAPLPNLIVVAQPGNFYASTDSSGNYELVVPRGKYQVSQILPQLKGFEVSQLCPVSLSYSVEFSGKNETITGKDFANKANIQPFLSVDIASDRRRRCFRNQTTVSYQNEGFASAAGVEIKVEYPDYVIPLSSSIPWKSKQGNTLIFDLGTVLAHSNGTISITDSVACGNESIRGLTQCIKAFISPRNEIPANSQWDQSSLALFAKCKENGFVGLIIKNIGNGNMADSTSYRIFLDANLVFTAKCKLNKNDSLVLEVPVNGSTIRLEADQVAYYPTDSKPSVTLEGCGSTAQTTISKGYVDQLPQDDAEPEVAISCMPILDSYDPNDKLASPAGITASKIIRKEDELTYTIRFQNTGNDVAYTVVIEDELSEYLDLSTLRIGASSHPCTWKLGGEGKAKITWTFTNINLPDSTSNEPGSHGFVQFSISQKKENALGSTIANQAYITFDYNSPIVTNLVTQMIGEIPSPTERIAVNICDGSMPDQAYAGENKQLKDNTTILLQATIPLKGNGRWKLISGAGNLANPVDPQTLVTEVGMGKNIFEWSVYLCDQQTSSQVTIERVVIPSPPLVQAPAAYCQDELIRPLIATGKYIEWFSDPQLSQLLATGEIYQPLISQTDTFYVTQTQYGYRSNSKMVVVEIKPKPSAPEAPGIIYYCHTDQSITLPANGVNVEWYADKQLSKKIGSGSSFTTSLVRDTTVYAIQRINGCPSAASAVRLQAGVFAPKEVYIPNVITPNGDEKNEVFMAPDLSADSCLGEFRGVQVFNRYGKKIFESSHVNFQWNGAGASSGIYYYVLIYSGYTYSGTLSVLY